MKLFIWRIENQYPSGTGYVMANNIEEAKTLFSKEYLEYAGGGCGEFRQNSLEKVLQTEPIIHEAPIAFFVPFHD